MKDIGKIQKIRIVSGMFGYGPTPQPDDEMEQHLSITRDGRVFFSSYVYGEPYWYRGRYKDGYRRNVTKNFKTDPEKTRRILERFEQYFSKDYVEHFATDVGIWEMEIKNDLGELFKFKGSVYPLPKRPETDLSDLVRDELDMPNLCVFDGNTSQNAEGTGALGWYCF